VDLEIEWSTYVLADIFGIDLEEMAGYIKYRANKMLRRMRLEEMYPEHGDNPMNWIRVYVDDCDGTKTYFDEQTSLQYTKTRDLNGFDDLYVGKRSCLQMGTRAFFSIVPFHRLQITHSTSINLIEWREKYGNTKMKMTLGVRWRRFCEYISDSRAIPSVCTRLHRLQSFI